MHERLRQQLKKDATAKKKEANELNKQIVNTEATIDSINVLLDNSGFEGFHLRAKDGVANTYEVIRPDGTVAEKLSEGERNFIACIVFRGFSSTILVNLHLQN